MLADRRLDLSVNRGLLRPKIQALSLMREEDDGALLGNLERIVSVAGLIAGECRSCTAVDTAYAKGPDGVGSTHPR